MNEKHVVWEGRFRQVVVEDGWEYVVRRGLTGIVGIIPVTGDGKVVLIEQYRVPVHSWVIEAPAGLAGDEPGAEKEPLEVAARRELLEETGYEASRLERLFDGVVSAGLTDEQITWFLATGCRKVGPGGGDGSEEITVHEVPIDEVLGWIDQQGRAGKLIDVKALGMIAFWLRTPPIGG